MKALLPIQLLTLYLFLLSLGAILSWSGLDGQDWLAHVGRWAAIFLSGYLTALALQKTFSVAPLRREDWIISSLILFLLIDPVHPWWLFFLLGVFAQAGARLIRTKGGPIFNPAALAAFAFGLAGFYTGWWGVNFPPSLSLPIIDGGMSVAMLLTVPLAGYVLYRYRKQYLVLSFVITFLVSHALLFGAWPFFLLLEGTIAFFLLVMVVEPKTSPNPRRDQYIYGAIVGIGMTLLMRLGWFDATLGTLLIANLYTAREFLASKLALLYGKREPAS